jgi:hypothetical protein
VELEGKGISVASCLHTLRVAALAEQGWQAGTPSMIPFGDIQNSKQTSKGCIIQILTSSF